MRVDWNRHILLVLLFSILKDVDGKGAGAKVRPKKGNKQKNNRNFGTIAGDQSGHRGDYSSGQKSRNASNEERLLAQLFYNYDPVARAVMDTTQTVKVDISFVLLRIHGLDERSQVLSTTGLIIAEWTDDRLTWDPDDYGNLTTIIIKAEKIWLPELAVMNGADELMPDFERIRVMLKHTGELHWEPGGIFRTTCDIDITYFPFDSQTCVLLIGAYSYTSDMMNITSMSGDIALQDFKPNGEWQVQWTLAERHVAVLACCPVEYPHVVFSLSLKRRSKFYMMNIVLPCFMLSVLIMVGFFLPPDAGEKISLGISVLLAFSVFLLMVADNIPRTSLAIPIMVIYLTATMSLGTISICMTVVVLNVHHRGTRMSVPPWARRLVLFHLARVLFVKTHYRTKLAKRHKLTPSSHKFKSKTDSNGILDDMELLGLTAVMNSRYMNNGPQSLPHSDIRSTTFNNGNDHDNCQHPSPLKFRQDTTVEELKDTIKESEEGKVFDQKEWAEFAHVLDRLFFWILFIFMTLSALLILLYPTYSGIDK